MKSPFTGGLTRIVREPATFKYRGQSFEVTAPQYECLDTQRRFTTSAQDEEFIEEVQRLYRERNFVPSAEEVKATRAKYGLSAARMSALLGFGTNQYSRYETGEIPTESNGTLIWLASHPEVFELLVQHKAQSMRPRQLEQVQRRLAKLGAQPTATRQAAVQLALPLLTATFSQRVTAVPMQPEEKALKDVVERTTGQPVVLPSALELSETPKLALSGDYAYAMAA